MTEFEKIETESVGVHRGDDRIPRDHLNRYRLPDPETGRVKSWTRVTTVAETLKDRRGLERWDQRNIIYGIGQRPALYAKAAAAKLTDRDTLDGIAKRAREAADAEAGADIGSALHTFTERVDKGERFEINEPFASDIKAYRLALEMTGIATAVGWIERVLFIPLGDGHAVVGTTDRVNNAMEWKLPRIGDVKTATDKPDPKDPKKPWTNTILRYGMVDIPLQLAMYAHASHWYDVEAEEWVEMPPVDRERAMVFHVPAGMGECRIYEIDIVAGWEAVEHAMWARGWRRRKDLAELIVSVDAKRTAPAEAGPAVEADDPPSAASRGTDHDRHEGGASDGGEGSRSQTGMSLAGKGGEAVSFPAADPPAPPSPPSNHDRPVDAFIDRFEWCRERVEAIKLHDGARARLAGLWSLRSEIPTFPQGGPRDADELSAVVGMCDLVEMEYGLPFGPPDPTAEYVGSTPADKRKAEIEAEAQRVAKGFATAQRRKAAKRKGKT